MIEAFHSFIGNNQMKRLSRNDGRPPKRTPPRPKTNWQPLPPLRPDREPLFEVVVENIGKMVYFLSRYKVITRNDSG